MTETDLDGSERDRHLAAVDAMARTMVDRAAPVAFRVAVTHEDREAVWRLRAETVIRRGWATANAFPDGMERDAYDDRAILIAGMDGSVLAATARLVLPSPGAVLPTEAHFGVQAEPRGQVANLDRMAVAPTHSDAQHRIMIGLAFACWLELRRHGYYRFLGVITPGMARLYRRAGWRVSTIGDARPYWGEQRTPSLFDPFDGFTTPVPEAPPPATQRA